MTIGIDLVLLDLGSIALSWHGLFLAAGVLVVYAIAVREGTRQGFSHRSLSELALWMIFLGFGGARLLSVLEAWPVYAADPVRILAVPEGGLTVTGAILGGLVAALIYARRRQLDGWRLLDVLALAVPAGCTVGRVGCTSNSGMAPAVSSSTAGKVESRSCPVSGSSNSWPSA
ncbi:MAG: prolipoprotein diacylglyceryl transferase [Anaerolineae bacterium]|nr:prolipoprotein diacylglyceryl transferase [Anaerolineae bacterium]